VVEVASVVLGLPVGRGPSRELDGARARFARGVRLVCNGESSGSRLRELLSPYKQGSCPVSIVYRNDGAQCRIDLGDQWRVKLDDDLIQSLAAMSTVFPDLAETQRDF
jgi:DNA polymerase-3 subunit alpha